MDYDLIQTISSIGFPIVACIAMACYVKYITDKNNKNIECITKTHKAEIDAFNVAISNNTMALQKLSDMIAMSRLLNGKEVKL